MIFGSDYCSQNEIFLYPRDTAACPKTATLQQLGLLSAVNNVDASQTRPVCVEFRTWTAFRTIGSPVLKNIFIVVASVRRVGKSLSAMQWDGLRRLMRQEIALFTEEIGFGLAAGTQQSAIQDTSSSVSDSAELFEDMISRYANYCMDNDRQRVGMCGLSEWWQPQAVSR